MNLAISPFHLHNEPRPVTRSPKTERLLQAKRKFAEKPVLRCETTWQFLGLIAFVAKWALF